MFTPTTCIELNDSVHEGVLGTGKLVIERITTERAHHGGAPREALLALAEGAPTASLVARSAALAEDDDRKKDLAIFRFGSAGRTVSLSGASAPGVPSARRIAHA